MNIGLNVMRLASPVLRRLAISDVRFSGAIFEQGGRGQLDWSHIERTGLAGLALTSGAAPVISHSIVEHTSQVGVVVEGAGTAGTLYRMVIDHSAFAGLELRDASGCYQHACVSVRESTIRRSGEHVHQSMHALSKITMQYRDLLGLSHAHPCFSETAGLYAHNGGAGQLYDVSLTDNRQAAVEIAESTVDVRLVRW